MVAGYKGSFWGKCTSSLIFRRASGWFQAADLLPAVLNLMRFGLQTRGLGLKYQYGTSTDEHCTSSQAQVVWARVHCSRLVVDW